MQLNAFKHYYYYVDKLQYKMNEKNKTTIINWSTNVVFKLSNCLFFQKI